MLDRFYSTPYIALHHIVGVIHDVTCQTKVTNLGHSVVGQEDISSSHVSVNTLRTHTHETQRKRVCLRLKSCAVIINLRQ